MTVTDTDTDFTVLVAGSRVVPQVLVNDLVRAYWGTPYYTEVSGDLPFEGQALLVRFDPDNEQDQRVVHDGVKQGMGVLVLGPDGVVPVEAVPAPPVIEIPVRRAPDGDPGHNLKKAVRGFLLAFADMLSD